MYLFLPGTGYIFIRYIRIFTFHNVSISTASRIFVLSGSFLYIPQCIYFYSRCICLHPLVSNFTFHNVSISTLLQSSLRPALPSLHSTMYLFLRGFPDVDIIPNSSLHSTMYLFLLNQAARAILAKITLHSTMYLFLRVIVYAPDISHSFTFHNVSISTPRVDREV